MNANNKPFVLYKASAGSGKTYTLIKEFLALCFKNDEKYYKEILAVTFTNKAANEMKAKILDNLNGIAEDKMSAHDIMNDLMEMTGLQHDEIKDKAKTLYHNIIHNYSDFNISTIDGFVQQVSRSFAKELNLPSQYKVLLDEDELLDEVLKRIDKKIGADDDFLTEILSEFIEYKLDNEEDERIERPLKDYIRKLLKENAYKKGELLTTVSLDRIQYQDVKKYLDNKIVGLEKTVRDNIRNIEDISLKYCLTENCYEGKSRGLVSIIDKIQKSDSIKDVDPSSLTTATVRKIFTAKEWINKKAPKDVIDKLNRDHVDVLKLYEDVLSGCNTLYFVNIIRNSFYMYVLRGKLMEIVGEHIDDTNKVHISEFNKRISDVLGDCSVPFIYERIGSRYRHFFIDEFQDTSILQWFNFLPLLNNSLSFGNKNLLVGDAKQAIYRFRSGEVEQIIKLPLIHKKNNDEFADDCEKNFVENWNPQHLVTNYRTRENIVEFNNNFFDCSKERIDNELYKSVYADNMRQRFRDKDYKGFVSVEIFKMDSFKEDGKRFPDRKRYKNAVKESVLKNIIELKTKGYSYKDITILVRNNADGSDIAEFLTKSEQKIPVMSSDSISLKSSDKVMLMILTLRHLLDEDNEVTKLAMAYYHESCRCQNADIRDLYDTIEIARNKDYGDIRNDTLSIYDLCAKIAIQYGFNIIDDVFLQYFMNLVNEWQNAENGGVSDFVEYWDLKSGSFFVKTTSDIDAVQIMTIHKSKGLEFKIVMYPYSYTRLPNKMQGGEIWLSCKDDFEAISDIPHIDNFILPVKSSLCNTIFEKYYVEEKEKAAFDDFNVMYVAMTRPKDMLFIYTNDERSKDADYNLFVDYMECHGDKYMMKKGQLDDDISYVYEIGEICRNEEASVTDTAGGILEADRCHDGATIDWTEVLKVDETPITITTEDESYQPQQWGVLVHEILSKINTIDDAERVVLPYLYSGAITERQAKALFEHLENIVNIAEIKDAYSDRCVVRSEMEILTSDGFILRPDRYAELDDKVILIDYKTGRQHEKYYEQLRSYMAALHDMGIRKNIEAYLLYIGDKVEIEQVFLDRLF